MAEAHNLPFRRQKCLMAGAVPPWGPTRPAHRLARASAGPCSLPWQLTQRHTICLFAVKSASSGRAAPSHYPAERGSMYTTTILTQWEATVLKEGGVSTLHESPSQLQTGELPPYGAPEAEEQPGEANKLSAGKLPSAINHHTNTIYKQTHQLLTEGYGPRPRPPRSHNLDPALKR